MTLLVFHQQTQAGQSCDGLKTKQKYCAQPQLHLQYLTAMVLMMETEEILRFLDNTEKAASQSHSAAGANDGRGANTQQGPNTCL